MNEKDLSIIVKASYSKCIKCRKGFQPKEEVVFLKNSNIMHKSCYEEVLREVNNE